jgi:glycyl-tRNA synthetase beta chain
MPDFLLEIGCEEIPARMIAAGAAAFSNKVVLGVQQAGSYPPRAGDKFFWTPRRLAIYLPNLPAQEPDMERDEVGPSWKAAFKDGVPTAAAEAFAKKYGVAVSALEKVTTPKGEYAGIRVIRRGRPTGDVMKGIVEEELKNISWEKTMYWRGKTAERFVRPVRWIVALLGDQVIPIEYARIVASRTSRGHRMIGQPTVEIANPGIYVETLRSAKVLLNPGEREQQIRKSLDAATREIPGARWREDKELLDTVVNLTEFPAAILGNFDPEFLELPEEVLVTVMRDHQKYFAVEDASGKLAPHFLAVLNTDGDPEGLIRHGHERVLRARFSDARFFWRTDQKHPLKERVEMLKHVTFQKDLGSYYDKTMRVQRLASWLSQIVKQAGLAIRPGIVHKAALLAKTDLTTELVKEFTELQGIVGGLYARAQVLDEDMTGEVQELISVAIYDHYKPESMEDAVPRTLEGAVLSIADKADSIAGMFALGLIPSGSKDPFALRRQANGIVKTIAEHQLPLSLARLMGDARTHYHGAESEKRFSAAENYAGQVQGFFRERLEFYLREAKGFAYDVVNAVLGAGSDDVVDAVARAEAVTRVRPSADFESISIACKRMKNILRQAGESGKQTPVTIDFNGLREEAEKELAAAIPQTAKQVEKLRAEHNYEQALLEIAKLRPSIDKFFDKVMVMVEDATIRSNRLALLHKLTGEFSTIADFSEIVTEGKSSNSD